MSAPSRLAPLLVALCIGLAAILHLPIIDDEAQAVELALSGFKRVLEAGLGSNGHFHPPLGDLLQGAWLGWVKPQPVWLARVPALVWWLGVCWLLPWSLAPVLQEAERKRALWAVVLFPLHWVFPFIATWYSLAAFLSLLATGAFLHVLVEEGVGLRRRLLLALWALATIALGYTVFAWPGFLLGQGWLAWRIVERERRWLVLRGFVPAILVIVLALAPTVLLIANRMSYAVAGNAGGGGLVPVGGVVALLAGPTVQASPALIIAASCTTLVGAFALLRRTRPEVRALFGMGFAVLFTLLATRTLSDKRLLLGSVFIAASIGAASASERRRMPVLCLVFGALPAAIGWCFPASSPLLFPRWADPLSMLAEAHCVAAEPRLFFGDHPALMLTVNARCGEVTAAEDEEAPISRPEDSALVLYRSQQRRTHDPLRRVVTVDLVAFLESPAGWLENSVSGLQALGFKVQRDEHLGEDGLARLRDRRERVQRRYHWVRLTSDRAGRPSSHE